MKATFKIGIPLVLMLAGCDRESEVKPDVLPSEVKSYLTAHFPEQGILRATRERDGVQKSYEVILDNTVKLEFNHKNEIIEIGGKVKLPDSVIPEKIREYVKVKYPVNFIIGWELERDYQQVELETGMDLEFTRAGDFIRIDP